MLYVEYWNVFSTTTASLTKVGTIFNSVFDSPSQSLPHVEGQCVLKGKRTIAPPSPSSPEVNRIRRVKKQNNNREIRGRKINEEVGRGWQRPCPPGLLGCHQHLALCRNSITMYWLSPTFACHYCFRLPDPQGNCYRKSFWRQKA